MTDYEKVKHSVTWWNVHRLNFLTEKCGITINELLKALGLVNQMDVKQLKQFAKHGEGLTESEVWVLNGKLDGFFRV